MDALVQLDLDDDKPTEMGKQRAQKEKLAFGFITCYLSTSIIVHFEVETLAKELWKVEKYHVRLEQEVVFVQ